MGTTKGEVLISYDINRLHSTVKSKMESRGYLDNFRFTGENKVYHLPNTTLWHPSKSSNQAIYDLRLICQDLDVTLEKTVSVKASEFVGI